MLYFEPRKIKNNQGQFIHKAVNKVIFNFFQGNSFVLLFQPFSFFAAF